MKIQLKRSNVLEGGKAKQPTAAQMEYGELAVNYNTADPTIFIKDSANGIVAITNFDDSDLQKQIDDLDTKVDGLESDLSDLDIKVNDLETELKGDIADLDSKIDTEVGSLNSKIDALPIPDPINGTAFQPGTLDVRYVSRFSWSDLPLL